VDYQLRRIRAESVISKAADELRRFIEERKLARGDALPAEMQLSAMLGISRSSVREALRVLDGLGFIEKRAGRRAVVRSPSGPLGSTPPNRANLMEGIPVAHAARMLIEQRCAELAARRMPTVLLAELNAHLSRFEESLKREDYVAAAQAHGEFHEALVRAAGNPILASMFESVRFSIARFAEDAPETFKDRRLPSLHRAILRAIQDGDPDRASAAVRRHFRASQPVVEFVTNPEASASASGDEP
jgi:GntR family transcriptional repressor for pyruvate dehydrogenase complex